jgi:hypothetical protein
MIVERRTFLIGLASLVAAPVVAGAETFMGAMSRGVLPSGLKRRKICGMVFSSMPSGEEIRHISGEDVQWTFYRDDEVLLAITINFRATLQRYLPYGHEWPIEARSVMRVVVEPCHTLTTLNIGSNIEFDPTRQPRAFEENFRWRDGVPELAAITAVNPIDREVLA